MSQKNCHLLFFYRKNNSVKREQISIIFGIQSLEETLQQKVVNLSTPPEICHRTTLWNSKKWFFKYITHRFRVFWLSFNKTNTMSECSWNHNCLLIFSLTASSLWHHGSVWRKSARKNWWKRIDQVALSVRRRCWTNFQSMKLNSFFVRKTV